jgi:hypothetical protein
VLFHLLFAGFLVTASTLFALLEIEIEGAKGWARDLPTWRIRNRWTRLVLGARPLTGYHLYVNLFLLLVLHLPYAFGFIRPSLGAELRILAFVALFWVLEDFLWFALNPAFGLRRFRRERIRWHAPDWWWIAPRDYWLFTPAGIALYVLSWVLSA